MVPLGPRQKTPKSYAESDVDGDANVVEERNEDDDSKKTSNPNGSNLIELSKDVRKQKSNESEIAGEEASGWSVLSALLNEVQSPNANSQEAIETSEPVRNATNSEVAGIMQTSAELQPQNDFRLMKNRHEGELLAQKDVRLIEQDITEVQTQLESLLSLMQEGVREWSESESGASSTKMIRSGRTGKFK